MLTNIKMVFAEAHSLSQTTTYVWIDPGQSRLTLLSGVALDSETVSKTTFGVALASPNECVYNNCV
jgi:hypothetical protein